MSQNLPKRSLRDFLSWRRSNYFVLLGANNETSSLPTDSSRPLFKQMEIFSGILTVYFNCKYFVKYTRELLECLLGISPSARNPCVGNKHLQTQGEIRRFRISEILRKSDGSSFRHISGGRKHVRAKWGRVSRFRSVSIGWNVQGRISRVSADNFLQKFGSFYLRLI